MRLKANQTKIPTLRWDWYWDHNLHFALVSYISSIVFFIFLVLRLEEDVTWNWFAIFIPIWVIGLGWLIWWYKTPKVDPINMLPDAEETDKDLLVIKEVTPPPVDNSLVTPTNYPAPPHLQYLSNKGNSGIGEPRVFLVHIFTFKTYQLFVAVGILIFLIFVANQLELSASSKWHWSIVFIPLWISFFIWFCSLVSYTLSKAFKSINIYSAIDIPLWSELAIYYSLLVFFTAFSIFLAIELETPNTVSMLTLFSPLLLYFGIVFWISIVYLWRKTIRKNTHQQNSDIGINGMIRDENEFKIMYTIEED